MLATPALAQPRPDADPPTKTTTQTNKSTDPAGGGKKQVVKTYDFNALDLNGRMRSPQLLYFLERASEELERASLEKRSFIPHLVRSLEEEAL